MPLKRHWVKSSIHAAGLTCHHVLRPITPREHTNDPGQNEEIDPQGPITTERSDQKVEQPSLKDHEHASRAIVQQVAVVKERITEIEKDCLSWVCTKYQPITKGYVEQARQHP